MNPDAADDILDAFTAEPSHDQATLQRYLAEYPELADDLIDLVRELMRGPLKRGSPLSPEAKAARDAAWQAHIQAAPGVADRLATLSVDRQRELCRSLNIPRQVLSTLREHQVSVATIPRHFLEALAALLDWDTDGLTGALNQPSLAGGRNYKAEGKPNMPEQIPFDELMRSCATPEQLDRWLPTGS